MANDPKYVRVFGSRVKLETSYLSGGSLAATDAVLLDQDDPPVTEVQYVNDGSRPGAPGSGAGRKSITPSGGFIKDLELTTALRGPGAAYSSSVYGRDQHMLLRASGHNATIDTTAGAENIIYTPTSGPPVGDTFASDVAELYGHMELLKVKGIVADMKMSFTPGDVIKFMFPISGMIDTLTTDVLLPTMTYMDPTVDPLKADGVAYTITPAGGSAFSPRIDKWDFAAKRKVMGPFFDPGSGNVYFRLGPDRAPEITMTIEKVDAATFDPVSGRQGRTVYAHAFSASGPNYNKMDFAAVQSQLTSVKPGKKDPLATWDLTFRLFASSYSANDDYSLKYKK